MIRKQSHSTEGIIQLFNKYVTLLWRETPLIILDKIAQFPFDCVHFLDRMCCADSNPLLKGFNQTPPLDLANFDHGSGVASRHRETSLKLWRETAYLKSYYIGGRIQMLFTPLLSFLPFCSGRGQNARSKVDVHAKQEACTLQLKVSSSWSFYFLTSVNKSQYYFCNKFIKRVTN